MSEVVFSFFCIKISSKCKRWSWYLMSDIGFKSLLNPCTRLDELLHPELYPEVGSILDDKYSVTQSLPGYYCYVKWWDGGPILWSWTKARDESGSLERRLLAQIPCFRLPHILVTPTRSSSVFSRVCPSSSRGVPKYIICLGSALSAS